MSYDIISLKLSPTLYSKPYHKFKYKVETYRFNSNEKPVLFTIKIWSFYFAE